MVIKIVPTYELKCQYCGKSLGDEVTIWTSAFIVECPHCTQHNHIFIKVSKNFVDPTVPIV